MIRVQCTRCAHQFVVEEVMRGRQDRCPQCATPVPVHSDAARPRIVHSGTVIDVPLSEIDDRLRPDFDRYLNALADAVVKAKPFTTTVPGANLTIRLSLNTGGRADFTITLSPTESALDTAVYASLLHALIAVPAPVTRGPAAQATLVFAVRGGE